MYCCGTLKGITDECNVDIGGINSVYIACWDNVQKPVMSNGLITTIVGSALGLSPIWKKYFFKNDTGNVVSTGQNQTNGMSSVTSVVSIQLQGITTDTANEINQLRKSNLAIIVEHSKGIYSYYGFYRPVKLTGDTMNTGTAFSDFEGFDLTFTENSIEYPYMLSTSAVNQLVGGS